MAIDETLGRFEQLNARLARVVECGVLAGMSIDETAAAVGASPDQTRLFGVAKSNPAWFFAYVAATLDFFCALRACEINGCRNRPERCSQDRKRSAASMHTRRESRER